MIHSIWELFVARFEQEEADDAEEEDSRFVPSPLDLSVRVGHGGRDDEVGRELSRINERAREIEETRRDGQ